MLRIVSYTQEVSSIRCLIYYYSSLGFWDDRLGVFLSNSSFGNVEGDQDEEVPKPVVRRSKEIIVCAWKCRENHQICWELGAQGYKLGNTTRYQTILNCFVTFHSLIQKTMLVSKDGPFGIFTYSPRKPTSGDRGKHENGRAPDFPVPGLYNLNLLLGEGMHCVKLASQHRLS